MTIERKVDVAPLFRHGLGLFCNAYNAWEHMTKHVLDARESYQWALLIAALRGHLDASARVRLHEKARDGSPDKMPVELADIWSAFLGLVADAAEEGVKRGWYWKETSNVGDGPYKAFATSGILTCFDGEFVRTGFLPFKGELPPGAACEQDMRYRLFVQCWRKTRFFYDRAVQERRFIEAPDELRRLMSKVPGQAEWEHLVRVGSNVSCAVGGARHASQ
jgi:hypothetical protein